MKKWTMTGVIVASLAVATIWLATTAEAKKPPFTNDPKKPFVKPKEINLAGPVGKVKLNKKFDYLPKLPAGKKFTLVWHDEFDGKTLNDKKWIANGDHPRKGGWWMKKVCSLDGKGFLHIKTIKEGNKYIAGGVMSKGRYEHAFGYYTARIKLQTQPGFWSAFWMQPRTQTHVGDEGRDGTEIDIMEKPWLDSRVQHTLHWDGYKKGQHKSKGKVSKNPGVMKGFHTFSLLWTPKEYVFYVDGRETWRTRAGGVCQVPVWLWLSSEVGSWGGDIKKAKLPDEFVVDYVRVYDIVPAK